MRFTKDQLHYLDILIFRAGSHCMDKLQDRCKELLKETDSQAGKEVVESGAKTVFRFETYLRKHLGIELKEGDEIWLTK